MRAVKLLFEYIQCVFSWYLYTFQSLYCIILAYSYYIQYIHSLCTSFSFSSISNYKTDVHQPFTQISLVELLSKIHSQKGLKGTIVPEFLHVNNKLACPLYLESLCFSRYKNPWHVISFPKCLKYVIKSLIIIWFSFLISHLLFLAQFKWFFSFL